MLVNEMKTEVKNAYNFLKKYCKEHNVDSISELFDKSTLIDCVNQADWDWSIKDEMECKNLPENEAIETTEKWFLSMSKQELYDRICSHNQCSLILSKAEELKFASDKF